MSSETLLVTLEANAEARDVIDETIGAQAKIIYLANLADGARADALANATAILALNTAKELRPGEAAKIINAKLLQFVSAGIDFIPLGEFPPTLPIASNGGGYAEPMAEHAVMITLAALGGMLLIYRGATKHGIR